MRVMGRDGWGRGCWPDALLAHCLAAPVGRATTKQRLVAQPGVIMATTAILHGPQAPGAVSGHPLSPAWGVGRRADRSMPKSSLRIF